MKTILTSLLFLFLCSVAQGQTRQAPKTKTTPQVTQNWPAPLYVNPQYVEAQRMLAAQRQLQYQNNMWQYQQQMQFQLYQQNQQLQYWQAQMQLSMYGY